METLWLSAKEVGTILGISKRAMHKRAAGWRFRVTKGRGGEKKLYGLSSYVFRAGHRKSNLV